MFVLWGFLGICKYYYINAADDAEGFLFKRKLLLLWKWLNNVYTFGNIYISEQKRLKISKKKEKQMMGFVKQANFNKSYLVLFIMVVNKENNNT